MLQQVVNNQGFEFSAEPRAVQNRGRYRDQGDVQRGLNTNSSVRLEYKMFDLRGLYQFTHFCVQQEGDLRNSKTSFRSKGQTALSKMSDKTSKADLQKEESPYIDLVDRPVDDEAKIIPDYYIDRPPTPEYRPKSPGREIGCQVEDKVLFDFKLEAEPILQVLVGKTIEQSRTELVEEHERKEELQHRKAYEKKRNAELMVTQRKEALYLRKQAEKERRDLQYSIQRSQAAETHKKYISRLLAKSVMNGMRDTSLRLLREQGVLRDDMIENMREILLPQLVQISESNLGTRGNLEAIIDSITEQISGHITNDHQSVVDQENQRRRDEAEKQRIAQEKRDTRRSKRREIRRRKKIALQKSQLLEQLEIAVINPGKENEEAVALEVTDIFPQQREAIYTVGGLLGEIWLILDILQEEHPCDLSIDMLLKFFVKYFNEVFKQAEFTLYVENEHRELVEELEAQMNEDLVAFNENRQQIIQDFIQKLSEPNCHQNLGHLYRKNLLNQGMWRIMQNALFTIYFASVDYKPPEKKVPEGSGEGEQQPKEGGEEGAQEGQEGGEEKKPEDGGENNEGGEKPAGEEGENGENKPAEGGEDNQEPPEPEWVPPEITEFDNQLVAAKTKIKLEYVDSWEFNAHFDALLRARLPLNREPPPSEQAEGGEEAKKTEEEASGEKKEGESEAQPAETKNPEDQVPQTESSKLQTEVEEEKGYNIPEEKDFIEPYDGSTFEKERDEFPEQTIPPGPFQIFNPQYEDRVIAHINERAQQQLRKELIKLLKANIEEWGGILEDKALPKAHAKSRDNDKIIIKELVKNIEEQAIFDIEVAHREPTN